MYKNAITAKRELVLVSLLRLRSDYFLMYGQYDTTGERACQENFEDYPAVESDSPDSWQ